MIIYNKTYPVGLYTPNFFIRAGLFILTCVISAFSASFLSLYILAGDIIDTYGWLAFLGTLNYIALHMVVKKKFHYRSGVDDALLWISFGLFTTAFYWALEKAGMSSYLAVSLFVFLLGSFLAIRFADMLVTLIAYLGFFAFIFFSMQKIGPWGIALMPFALMLVSGLLYWLAQRSLTHSITLYYANSMIVLQTISLVTLYASGNYYMVKELGDMLNNTRSESIPFGWLFWILTSILPIAYIVFGLKKKDPVLIRVGLLLCIAACLTFRNYYHIMPLELVLILCGTLVLVVSWLLTNYLKTPKYGFTYRDLSNNNLIDELKLESLIISESSSGIGNAPANTGTQMGGGKFGGGGASGEF